MIPAHKQKTLIAAKKAQSHLAKVTRMIEEDVYCINIMQQILAVQGLLKSMNGKMLEGHFQTCFRTAMEGKNEKQKTEAIKEVMRVVKLNTK